MKDRFSAPARQLAGLLGLLFGALSGFQLGRHVSMWMYAREHGGVVSTEAVALSLPLMMAAFAAAMASRNQVARAMTGIALIVFATIGMLTQRFAEPKDAIGADAGHSAVEVTKPHGADVGHSATQPGTDAGPPADLGDADAGR